MTHAVSADFRWRTVQRRIIVRTVIGTVRAKYMPKAHLKLVASAIVNRTVMPRRPPNADLRTREHLTEVEVERLMDAAQKNRWGHRDATMVLLAYGGIGGLRWDQQCALIFSMRLPSGISDAVAHSAAYRSTCEAA